MNRDKKPMKKIEGLRWILSFGKKERCWLIFGLLVSGLLILTNLSKAYVLRKMVNHAVESNFVTVIRWVCLVGGVILVGTLISYFAKYAIERYSLYTLRELKEKLAQLVGVVDFEKLVRMQTGDLASRLNSDLEIVEEFLKKQLPRVALEVVTGLAAFFYVFFINWKLLLVSLSLTPLLMYFAYYLNNRAGQYYPKSYQYLGEATGQVEQSITNIEIIKALQLEKLFCAQVHEKYEETFQMDMQAQKYVSIIQAVCFSLSYFPRLICLIYGGTLVLRGTIDVGAIVAVMQLFDYLIGPTVYLPFFLNSINRAIAAIERVAEVLDLPIESQTGRGTFRPEGNLALRLVNLSFGYDGDQTVLDQINLEIQPNKLIALVGPSGSGKSTICNLICWLYPDYQGKIELFGEDIAMLTPQAVREQITVVSQDTYLFPGTIEENIGYGKKGASALEIRRAAQAAYAHDFITELTQGYKTRVGEGGVNLSGGQRQRIAIARAFLKDAPLLILDEPTASLDTHAERQVQHSLKNLMQGRTVFVIAHRLSTIIEADQILVLDQGRIVERGTHEELLRLKGTYYLLYHTQISNSQEEEKNA